MEPTGFWLMAILPFFGSFLTWTIGAWMLVYSAGWTPQFLWLLLACTLAAALSMATFGFGWPLGVLFSAVGLYEYLPLSRWASERTQQSHSWGRIALAVTGALVLQVMIGVLAVVGVVVARMVMPY